MIKPVPCYTLICDSCGKNLYDGTEYSGWSEPAFIVEDAMEQCWHVEDGKHYCENCWHFDDDDNLIIGKQQLQCKE